MLSITQNIVNDRISIREDNVAGIVGLDMVERWLQHLRCLTHQMCFAFERGNYPRGLDCGFKRNALKPAGGNAPAAPAPLPPTTGWMASMTSTARVVWSSV